MLSITLAPQDEYRWKGKNPAPHTFPVAEGKYPLYHQWRTYNAEAPIIINTHATGTGKTKAALLRLLKRAETRGFDRLASSKDNVLFVVPTNELLTQHEADAKNFCTENALPYRVLPITKDSLESYKGRENFSEEHLRGGAALHYLLNDPSAIDHDTGKRATIFVVNPDIFYYAIYSCYNSFDRAPLFNDFFRMNYIIIDEFHYYNPKQFAAFLFFMKLSKERGYIESIKKQRQFCILTATPDPRVTQYLRQLGVPIDEISPGADQIAPQDLPFVEPVRALTPVQLHVYSTEELRENDLASGLLRLVTQERQAIRQWLGTGTQEHELSGAIISGSLGAVNRIHQQLLQVIPASLIGRITGAQAGNDRKEAREKPLILATPTVDIGYNFERAQPRQRQTIDFLFLDASSGDELVQRIGRAGRVLARAQKEQPSIVYAVVDAQSYRLLQDYDGKLMERSTLSRLAAEMTKKHNLYAYVRSGAILEAFRPLHMMSQGMSDQEKNELNNFFLDLQVFFAAGEDARRKPLAYQHLQRIFSEFERRQQCYRRLHTLPAEAFELLPLLAEGRIAPPEKLDADTRACLAAFIGRLKIAHEKHEASLQSGKDVVRWIQQDLVAYFKEKARFSFRESFQPPLALVYDPQRLHSDQEVAAYSALHFVKYYHARFHAGRKLWEEATGRSATAWESDDILAYCVLEQPREKPLQIGLQLDARTYSQDAWEEQFAYQVTALYGLQIVILNEHSGIAREIQELFSTRFVPAFLALDDARSATLVEIYKLRRQARFYPVPVAVTFNDGRPRTYQAILGSLAFLLCAEIPSWAMRKDRRQVQRENDEPLIY
ncbi:MAG: type I-D CRISPR-associated helicase Cas3' [Ktedonobacteraceae bacterium]|nr:type I-D CRISPR-associated helicase Cas3' [Ktedonobacteraceae bacterium]